LCINRKFTIFKFRLAIIQLEYILIFKCNNNDDPHDIIEQKLVYNTSPNPRALFDIKNDIFVYPQVNKEQSLLVTVIINNNIVQK